MAYVMMDSVREKEEQEGKTAAMVGVFVLPEREKNQDAVVYPPILFIFAANIEVFIFFAKSIIMRFFSSTRFLEFVYARPVRCCEL